MSWKDFFIETDDDTKKIKSVSTNELKENPVQTSKPEGVSLPLSNGESTLNTLQTVSSEPIDEKFIDHFGNLLDKANLPGPDYYEFMLTLKGMQDVGIPEDKMFKGAYNIFKTQGGKDIKTLIISSNQYLTIMQTDKMSFESDVKNKMNENVGSLQAGLNSATQEIETDMEEIAKLQQAIEEKKKAKIDLQNRIEQETNNIENKKAQYYKAFDMFTNKIKQDQNKIKQYLGE